MRLIDADKIGLTDFEIVMCNGDYKEALKMLLDKISNQPTAYDVDKVVEELEEKIADMNFCEYRDAFIDAIEIVKQGGVSNDVCEWVIVDRPHNLPIYNTSCGKIRLQYVTGVDIYCNGCGKKIKVVELWRD